MKKILLAILSVMMIAFLLSAYPTDDTKNKTKSSDSITFTKEEFSLQDNSDSIANSKSLNDIRFDNFKGKDWIDNDYIKALRNYIDSFKNGKVKNEGLEKYRNYFKGKFVIGHTAPYLLGGLFIEFIFVDRPEDVFSVWVYSGVDEKKEEVVDYSVREIDLENEKSGFTSKQQILDLLKEHPEYKMW